MNVNNADSVNLEFPKESALILSREDTDFLTKSPVKFIEGNFADYIWGGYHLYDMKGLPRSENSRIAAESWEVSGHRKYPSRVQMPDGRVFSLIDLLKDRQLAGLMLGEAVVERFGQEFPILVKFVDVHQHMSVHLHPSQKAARALGEKDPGKEEVFVVIGLHEGAESALYLGLKEGVTRGDFEAAIDKGENLLDLSYKVYVKPGEIYRIPSGVIHCWTGGSIAIEIAEPSDLTYRMYDFRRNRPMHIKKGLASISYNRKQGAALEKECRGLWHSTLIKGIDSVITRNALKVERISAGINGNSITIRNRDTFEVLMGINGATEVTSLKDDWSIRLDKGSSLLIPAKAGGYRVRGFDETSKNCALRISMKVPERDDR